MVAKLLRFLGIAALASLALAACPNKCSGHGTCGPNDICSCQQNWVNADCSGRQCPFTRAWQDTPMYSDDAHYYVECGGRGQCDRATGICNCEGDFTGSGCRRLRCPGDCNGHGTCLFIEELAVLSKDPRVGGKAGTTYTLWDREKIQGCQCDPGWEGHNCLSRVCPKGDDPLTVNDPAYPAITQVEMKQGIAIYGTGTVSIILKYTDPYGNIWSTSAISGTNADICANIQTELRKIPNLALFSTTLSGEGQVTVSTENIDIFTRSASEPAVGTYSIADADVLDATRHFNLLATCVVSFPAGPGTSGYQYPLTCDVAAHPLAGSQPLQTAAAVLTTTACTVHEHYAGSSLSPVTLPLTELATCSNRGVCDSSRGECQCFTGHKGLACDLQEALV
ncbi:hypothetical protein SPRG_02166 [Saprolegnia parasitica CBS 223.65]|uniref:EGF-like domain-containing protein n=1 Tax=Saprolegnia parasitica (strain CBS 223.65) TaxID=695850 RepID=A0A067CRM9_SAPPC|nr:hypothetical protein SPRG_02166 [Saprolegnia parasitica CBS 223.65]KDO33359.1 hypothetical protein SPRG_02166 [Saprolegnia parasitica CBS 223.65]|eukprot:XP_012196107.1 hypothetical protein SPRG_02166 [Saprolegnia parasitica CBS 223.65]